MIRPYEGNWWLPWVIFVLMLASVVALWQIIGSQSPHLRYFVGTPLGIFDLLQQWISSGTLWGQLAITLEEGGIGFVVGALLGIALAVLSMEVHPIGETLEPMLSGLIALPTLVLIPFFIAWFGLGLLSKIAFVAFIVTLVVFVNVVNGLRVLDGLYLSAARLQGASKIAILRDIYLPGIAMWLVAGFRIAVPLAFASAVVSEYVGSVKGLGWLILRGFAIDQVDQVFAGLTVMAIVVVILDIFIRIIVQRTEVWRS